MKTILSIVLVSVATTPVLANLEFSFLPVALEGDDLPVGTFDNNGGSDDPAIGDSGVVASEAEIDGTRGVLTFDVNTGDYAFFAQVGTPRPGVGNFTFRPDNSVVDAGLTSFDEFNGGYFIGASDGSGVLTSIADTTTVAVDTAGNPLVGNPTFDEFGDHGRSGNYSIFEATPTGGVEGLYENDNGTLRLLLQENDASPLLGAGLITSVAEPHVNDGNWSARVRANSGNSGIIADFGILEVIADENTASPSGLGNFTGFDESAIDGDRIVFQANTASGAGVYMYDRSTMTLTTIADRTNLPGPFTIAGNPSISGDYVLVEAENGSGLAAIFIWADGQLYEAFRDGGQIDGMEVGFFDLRDTYSLEGNRFAFSVSFSDPDVSGIYIGEIIPEPASAALLGLAAVGLLGFRKRQT